MIPYFNIVQGTPEWHELRRIRACSSEAKRIITPAQGKLSSAAREYAIEIAAQTFFNEDPDPPDFFGTADTRKGKEREPEARAMFAELLGEEVVEMGFATSDDGIFGCSPDGYIPSLNQGLELKCPRLLTYTNWLMEGRLPDAHKPQCHFVLAITGWEALNFCAYFPTKPLFRVVVRPDLYTAAVVRAMDEFREIYHSTRNGLEALFSITPTE